MNSKSESCKVGERSEAWKKKKRKLKGFPQLNGRHLKRHL